MKDTSPPEPRHWYWWWGLELEVGTYHDSWLDGLTGRDQVSGVEMVQGWRRPVQRSQCWNRSWMTGETTFCYWYWCHHLQAARTRVWYLLDNPVYIPGNKSPWVPLMCDFIFTFIISCPLNVTASSSMGICFLNQPSNSPNLSPLYNTSHIQAHFLNIYCIYNKKKVLLPAHKTFKTLNEHKKNLAM